MSQEGGKEEQTWRKSRGAPVSLWFGAGAKIPRMELTSLELLLESGDKWTPWVVKLGGALGIAWFDDWGVPFIRILVPLPLWVLQFELLQSKCCNTSEPYPNSDTQALSTSVHDSPKKEGKTNFYQVKFGIEFYQKFLLERKLKICCRIIPFGKVS